jgi:MFS family permease
MHKQDGGSWVIVGVLFATMFFIWGPVNASGVFFLPVIQHFGWSRGLLSALVATAPLAAELSSPVVGALLDRLSPRKVMVTGAAMVALSYLALSRANSAAAFLAIFVVLGIGITASTIIPSAVVVTNLFRERRGLAIGIVFAGLPLGGTGISILANHVVLQHGFRAGYVAMALPILFVVIPLMMIFLRVARGTLGTQAASLDLPGLEVREALRTRSFWMIAIAEVLFATAGVGIRVHLVPYLTGIGYTPTHAAQIFGAMFLFSAAGSFLAGRLADRFGGRSMLAMVFLACAVGIVALLGAAHLASLALFVLVFGVARETFLLPLVIGESLGAKRLGALLGILAFFTTLGFAAGPIIAGRIFDVAGSYSAALILFAAMVLLSSLAIRATRPFAEERARLEVEHPAAEASALA